MEGQIRKWEVAHRDSEQNRELLYVAKARDVWIQWVMYLEVGNKMRVSFYLGAATWELRRLILSCWLF